MQRAVIVSACRTPIGSFQGKLSRLSATQLGSAVIKEALDRTRLAADQVDEVIMGNVLSAGLGQAPARQAALGAGLPYEVTCTTLNKVCGSGLKAVMLAAQSIMVGDSEVVIAGGMESMSNAPYLLPQARTGYRMGSGELVDSMIHDGLWDVYNQFHMGAAGEICARVLKISREEQDDFALRSYERARQAQMNGEFAREIVAVKAPQEGTEDSPLLEQESPNGSMSLSCPGSSLPLKSTARSRRATHLRSATARPPWSSWPRIGRALWDSSRSRASLVTPATARSRRGLRPPRRRRSPRCCSEPIAVSPPSIYSRLTKPSRCVPSQ
jgi:acetyl-CoA acetyltransferase